ncbi:MAG TPA: hypothetical protein ENK57_23885 [Polyangiaceae bacterium]|nr:hypothetical protein [Polyangiaceae bacterium]
MKPLRHLLSALLVVLTAARADAQQPTAPADDPKKADEPAKDEGWSSLEPTAENAPEDATPDEEPQRTTPTPYRADLTDPFAIPEPKKPEADDEDEGYSESVAWMKDWLPRYASSRAGLDFDVFLDDPTAMTWDLVARVAFGKESTFALDLGLPWAWADGGEAIIGNPVIGLLGGGKLADPVGMYGGFWIGIPTKPGIPDLSDLDAQARSAQALVTALLRAGIHSHRFIPIWVPLRFGIGAELQLHPLVYLRTELAPQINVGLEGANTTLTIDHITDVEVLSPIGLGGGLRLQEYFTPLDTPIYSFFAFGPGATSVDRAQVALEPYVAYEPPRQGDYAIPIYTRIGLLMALDDPLGFGFSSSGFKVATLRTSVGATF